MHFIRLPSRCLLLALAAVVQLPDASARPIEVPKKMKLTPTKSAALSQANAQFVAFHSDGRRWAAALPGMVYLWEGETLSGSFETSPTHELAFSADGRKILGSPDRIDLEKRQLEPLPGALSVTLNAMMRSFDLVASGFTPDGNDLVAVASFRPRRGIGASDELPPETEQILLLDGTTRVLRRVLWKGNDPKSHAVTVDAHHIAVADLDVWLWSRSALKTRRVLKGPAYQVLELRFSPDGKLLGAVDADGMATLWDTATGKQRARWKVHEHNSPRLAFHPRLPVLATGSGDGAIKLWSIAGAAPALLATATDQGGAVEGLAFSPAGDRLLAAVNGRPMMYEVSPEP